MQAVLDPNVLISALLSRDGSPARVVRAWVDGDFDLVVSPSPLAELERALGYGKIRRSISEAEAEAFLNLLRRDAMVMPDPDVTRLTVHSCDPGDDYLVALGEACHAYVVSGDRHLLDLADRIPVVRPAAFLEIIKALPTVDTPLPEEDA